MNFKPDHVNCQYYPSSLGERIVRSGSSAPHDFTTDWSRLHRNICCLSQHKCGCTPNVLTHFPVQFMHLPSIMKTTIRDFSSWICVHYFFQMEIGPCNAHFSPEIILGNNKYLKMVVILNIFIAITTVKMQFERLHRTLLSHQIFFYITCTIYISMFLK